MLFFYVRHGDPIYNPDSLTPLGLEQAEAIKYRLAQYGLDKIYASSSNRAILTATPTAELLGKEIEILDWCNESYAWQDFSMPNDENYYTWSYNHPHIKKLYMSDEIRMMGRNWYDHEAFKNTRIKEGTLRVEREVDAFMLSLGYRNDRDKGYYIAENPTNERVALFVHEGFGTAFLSALLDMPYPLYSTHFTMCHTGMTVINFAVEKDGSVFPKVLTLSSDSHIYAQRLPTRYNNGIPF